MLYIHVGLPERLPHPMVPLTTKSLVIIGADKVQRAHEGLREVFAPNLLMLALCSWFTAFLVQGTGQHTHEGIRLHLLTVLQLI